MATIRDVAKLAGVSISTVSVAIRDPSQVTPETYERIEQAARSVGYRPNPLAQSLKTGRQRLFGVLIASMSNPYFSELMDGIEKTAMDHDHLVILADSRLDQTRERAILESFRSQRVAGVILHLHAPSEEQVAYLNSLEMPLVLIDHKIAGVEGDFVGIENRRATAMLTEHLIRLGHRRIAHITGGRGLWTTEERIAGFQATLAEAGILEGESRIVEAEYFGEEPYDTAMRLLTSGDRPTAIVAGNNVIGLTALEAINDLGLKCPEDISLTTMDDVPWSKVIQPNLTAAVQPIAEIARAATTFLLDRINGKGGETIAPRERIFMPRLVVGRSCAPPKA